MNDMLKLAIQGLGVFAMAFGPFFWALDGAPLPYVAIKTEAMRPDPRVPVFQPVEVRLGHPEYLQEDQPQAEPQGDNDPRRMKYRTILKEAIETVEADHCAMLTKKCLPSP